MSELEIEPMTVAHTIPSPTTGCIQAWLDLMNDMRKRGGRPARFVVDDAGYNALRDEIFADKDVTFVAGPPDTALLAAANRWGAKGHVMTFRYVPVYCTDDARGLTIEVDVE